MTWADSFIGRIPNAKLVIDANGSPFVSTKIAPQEYVDIEIRFDRELPFQVTFRRYDLLGGILEERIYASAGTKELAHKSAMEVIALRLNSTEFVLDGE